MRVLDLFALSVLLIHFIGFINKDYFGLIQHLSLNTIFLKHENQHFHNLNLYYKYIHT